MRGDVEKGNSNTPLESDVKIVANNRRMGLAAAIIVDNEGTTVYHVLSTLWSKLIIIAILSMIAATTVTVIMVYYNSTRIDELNLENQRIKNAATELKQEVKDNDKSK